jgi:hypothetical protein
MALKKQDAGASLPFLTPGIRSQQSTDLRVSAVPVRWHLNATQLSADPIAYDVHFFGERRWDFGPLQDFVI